MGLLEVCFPLYFLQPVRIALSDVHQTQGHRMVKDDGLSMLSRLTCTCYEPTGVGQRNSGEHPYHRKRANNEADFPVHRSSLIRANASVNELYAMEESPVQALTPSVSPTRLVP